MQKMARGCVLKEQEQEGVESFMGISNRRVTCVVTALLRLPGL